LFISAPFSGIEVFMRNMNLVNEEIYHFESSWIWLQPALDFSGMRRVVMAFVNWTVKASYFTHRSIFELESSGKKFDAAFVNHITPITFLFSFRRRIPIVLSIDSTPKLMDRYPQFYRNNPQSKFVRWLLHYKYLLTRSAYADASKILAWSEVVKQSLIDDYKIPEHIISVVPPGVDCDRFTPVDRSTREPGLKVKVLFVGGDFLRKGGDLLLALAKEERFRNHEFHFVTHEFTGNTGNNVFVHTNITPDSEMLPALYREADMFVLPTRGDFCPTIAICEAMATGLPVISTTVGGLDEIVIDRTTGLIIGVDDKEDLAAAIETLSADASLRLRLGSAAREWVTQQYDIKKNSEAVFFHLIRAADTGVQRTRAASPG
jgi:glycosyltransferase involved in cell wall biosynthesis